MLGGDVRHFKRLKFSGRSLRINFLLSIPSQIELHYSDDDTMIIPNLHFIVTKNNCHTIQHTHPIRTLPFLQVRNAKI